MTTMDELIAACAAADRNLALRRQEESRASGAASRARMEKEEAYRRLNKAISDMTFDGNFHLRSEEISDSLGIKQCTSY